MSNPPVSIGKFLTVEQKSELFDALYGLAQFYIDSAQPCRWKDGACYDGGYRKNHGCRLNGCCNGNVKSKKHDNVFMCKYLNEDTGCTIKCLGCKTHLCSTCLDSHTPEEISIREELRGRLQALRRVAEMFGIATWCYMTKEDAVKFKSY